MTDKMSATRPNKSQLKRDMKVLHDLGKTLVELMPGQLAKISLSASMSAEIISAKTLKKSALKRQLRYISGKLQEEDVTTIQSQLHRLTHAHKQGVKSFHQVEQWRDRLIGGDTDLLNQLVEKYVNAERQHLRQLVRNASKEASENKPPKASRLLYKYLQKLQQEHSSTHSSKQGGENEKKFISE